MEPNTGLTFKQDNVLLIYKDGELAAMEIQNGEIHRYVVSECKRGDSMTLFGVDRPTTN